MDTITAELHKKIENYRDRYDSPTKETIERWKKEAERKAASKNQLRFSFAQEIEQQGFNF